LKLNYRGTTFFILFCCLFVYGVFLIIQVNISNQQFHQNAHNNGIIYAKLVSNVLEDLNKKCNIFNRQYYKIDKTEFEIDFVEEGEFKLTDDYYKKIGTGTHQRYYTDYWDCVDFKKRIQQISDTFLYNSDILFILSMDVNGYCFVHHENNSQKISSGDFVMDNKISRHCRIWPQFTVDKISKYYNIGNYMTYERDTGFEYGVTTYPIFVDNKQWGSVIMAYDFKPYEDRMYNALGNFLIATFTLGLILLIILPILLKRELYGKNNKNNRKVSNG